MNSEAIIAVVKGGFPKTRGSLLGIPRKRIIVCWGVGFRVGVHLFRETIDYVNDDGCRKGPYCCCEHANEPCQLAV